MLPVSCGWAGPRMEHVVACTEPKGLTQLHALHPARLHPWASLGGRREGARDGKSSTRLKSFSPFHPPGRGPGLASFMENQYRCPQREHSSLRTCSWIGLVWFGFIFFQERIRVLSHLVKEDSVWSQWSLGRCQAAPARPRT